MKKLFALIFALTIVLALTACGGGNNTQNPSQSEPTSHTHNYSSKVTNPTCTEKGYTTYSCACGHTYTADETDAAGHAYTQQVTEPTCTLGGYTTYSCACGHTYTADETDATGHAYTQQVTEPTCTLEGYTTYSCSCGDTHIANEVAAKGHTYSAKITMPTCISVGYTTYTCECGDSYKDNYTDITGHNWKVATCTAPKTCTECGATEGVVDHGDSTTIKSAIAPTCTQDGYTGNVVCNKCNIVLAVGKEIPKLEHTGGTATCNKKAICSRCNNEYGDFNAANHSGSTTIKNAINSTCSQEGYTGDTYCKDCDTLINRGSSIKKNRT